jgi:hypothetical protein
MRFDRSSRQDGLGLSSIRSFEKKSCAFMNASMLVTSFLDLPLYIGKPKLARLHGNQTVHNSRLSGRFLILDKRLFKVGRLDAVSYNYQCLVRRRFVAKTNDYGLSDSGVVARVSKRTRHTTRDGCELCER